MASAATDVGLREATLRGLAARAEAAADDLAVRRARLAALRGDHATARVLPAAARAEILRARSSEIAARTRARTLVELGAGNAREDAPAARRARTDARALRPARRERGVPPHDAQKPSRRSTRASSSMPFVGDFERDLHSLPAGGPRLIALLGSTIGNFYPAQRRRFLSAVAGALDDEDAFLVGVDLVKDVARLEAAYNDEGGVTETFVRNALDRRQPRARRDIRPGPLRIRGALGSRARVDGHRLPRAAGAHRLDPRARARSRIRRKASSCASRSARSSAASGWSKRLATQASTSTPGGRTKRATSRSL